MSNSKVVNINYSTHKRDLFAYAVNPVDFGWERLKTLSEAERDEEIHCAFLQNLTDHDEDAHCICSIRCEFAEAMSAARSVGWHGDFREEVRVMPLPVDGGIDWAFIWKQDNNGTTFVVSPVPLDYLLGISFKTSYVPVGAA